MAFSQWGFLLSVLWLLTSPGLEGVSVMIDEGLKGRLIQSCLGFSSVLRCFGIWPSYWTTSPLPAFDRHIHCLSLNLSAFCTRLINRYLFCASQQSPLNPVTPLYVFFCESVCVRLRMDKLLYFLGAVRLWSVFQTHRDFELLTIGHLLRILA